MKEKGIIKTVQKLRQKTRTYCNNKDCEECRLFHEYKICIIARTIEVLYELENKLRGA